MTIQQKQAESIHVDINSILLIGVGSSITRIFLDELSEYLTKSLKDSGIVAKYYYLGKDRMNVQSEIDTINKQGFKAILFLLPTGASSYDVQAGLNRMTLHPNLGGFNVRTARSKISYQQDFDFQLYLPGLNMKKIWAASVSVSGDPSKFRTVDKVGTKLLLCF